MADPASETTKPIALKTIPPAIYVCPLEKDAKKHPCATISVGFSLKLRILDARTKSPVAGAAVRAVTIAIAGKDEKIYEAAFAVPHPVPKHVKASQADACRRELKELEDILAIKKSKRTNKQKATAKRIRGYKGTQERVVAEREAWVRFMQTGLGILKAYDGPITARANADFAALVKQYWQHWRGPKVKYDPNKVAGELYKQLVGRQISDAKGCVVVPLPHDYAGKVKLELTCLKLVHPDDAAKVLAPPKPADPPAPSPYRPRVDYDFAKANAEGHKHDRAGSTEALSRWNLVVGAGRYAFRNFIEVEVKAPTGAAAKKPVALDTLALVWCQPTWTVLDRSLIWDPPNPQNPNDPASTAPREAGIRGIVGRGEDAGVPTLLACTKGMPHKRSKYYGVWGRWGRKKNNAAHPHAGIDCSQGDPLFAISGGTVIYAGNAGGAIGNTLKMSPWLSTGPTETKYFHLKKDDAFVVKAKDVVKAGDFVGKMGRTGHFPSVSPTHVHVMWKGGADAMYNAPSGLEAHAGVIPSCAIPKVFPCGEEYGPTLPAAADPRKCKFALPAFLDGPTCFAVVDLSCPFIPKTIEVADLGDPGKAEAKRRVQAQLLHLREKDKDTYAKPGKIDGSLGKDLPSVKMTGAKSRTVREYVTTDPPPKSWPTAFEADKDEVFVLVDSTRVGSRYKIELDEAQAKKYSAKVAGKSFSAGQILLVHKNECKIKHLGKARAAIRAFNREHDPDSKFELSAEGLRKLDAEAPIDPQNP